MRVIRCVSVAAFSVALAAPAALGAPLFVNAGFETGDFTGWTITYAPGGLEDGTVEGLPVGNTVSPNPHADAVVVPVSWGTDPYTGDVVPKVAPPTVTPNFYSARIGDANNQIDHLGTGSDDDDPTWVTLSQIGTVTELVDRLAVQWAAAVTEPKNWEDHIGEGFPFLRLYVKNLTQDVVLLDVMHTSHELGAFWEKGPAQGLPLDDPNNAYGPTRGGTEGDWWYKDWTVEVWDMSGAALGDQILIALTAHDCGLRGHPAYVRLDDIGLPEVPPIPEPTTMVLLVGGLAAAGWRIRRRMAA